ncbi:tRNA (adenosine(37)-N6)-threonylcarbamoyltransferase complex transferase subunit TsaD [Zavarzinia sp. CC-PAN008]|uniref:tRNA (adenosine(37)-N6)-threonylcarbamoyltransferase complex transferase subunit TsaD n=1 Tax=Zavarzinia sp. CC-PAN008 TaxID=3243332 RepID=UPI003F749D12
MKTKAPLVLGVETSCDETAAAIVSGDRDILANEVLSQVAEHTPFGGVVPEIAARAHVEHLDRLIARALATAGVGFGDLAAIAATAGPGLIGGVMVGLVTAKAIAAVHDLPLLAVNHLEGHALTARLVEPIGFPYLLLLVSGGHCQLLRVQGVGQYRRLGTTQDDAVGEAFDKVAQILGLGFPGGPAVERAARNGDATRFDLPRPLLGRAEPDFSFSGLKTAVRQLVDRMRPLSGQDQADVAASFQAAVADVMVDRTARAMALAGPMPLVVAGGVAANQVLRARLGVLADSQGQRLVAPPLKLCTDNAAMIAWAGHERLAAGLTDPLDIAPRARWPLDPGAILRPGVPERLRPKA